MSKRFAEEVLTLCSQTLPKAGSMRNGRLSERPTLAPHTDAPVSSWWPTAQKSDARSSGRHTTSTGISHAGTSLTDAARDFHRDGTILTSGIPSGPPAVLCPVFVEWLMGFPDEWTESRRSEMQLFLPLQK